MFRDTGRAKLPSVIEYLKENFFDELDEMPKIIIFALHQDILDAIQLEIQKKKVNAFYFIFLFYESFFLILY